MAKLRKLRVMLAAAEAGSVAQAAHRLNLSQPAVTRAIQSLEAELGVSLFDRPGRGIECNDSGRILASRISRALGHLRAAETLLLMVDQERSAATPLSEQASDHELSAVLNVAAHGSVSAAARKAGISQPALNRSLRMLEKRIGRDLFHRTAQGMRTTPAGDEVVRRTKLAFSEIRQGLEEVAFATGTAAGRIRIGALPLTQIRLVPFALKSLMEIYPAAEIAVEDGSYTALLSALRHGDIDLLVGTLRDPPPAADIASMTLFEDEIAIVVGADHPLAACETVSLADCLEWDWVLPFKGVPLRVILEEAITSAGLRHSQHIVETDSMTVARTLLVEGRYVAALSPHQVYYEQKIGLLKILPVTIARPPRPVGVTMREDFRPTPLMGALLEELQRVAGRIGASRSAADA